MCFYVTFNQYFNGKQFSVTLQSVCAFYLGVLDVFLVPPLQQRWKADF